MKHTPSNCAYYDGGYCKKGLPGTLCELTGCVAWMPKPIESTTIHYHHLPGVKPLTWQDIKAIVEIADRLVTEDPNDHPAWIETEESYYKAVLDEYLKTKEK